MGKIRLEYPMSLITEILESGLNAIQITLGNPELHGPEAFQDVLDELAAYEKHIVAGVARIGGAQVKEHGDQNQCT